MGINLGRILGVGGGGRLWTCWGGEVAWEHVNIFSPSPSELEESAPYTDLDDHVEYIDLEEYRPPHATHVFDILKPIFYITLFILAISLTAWALVVDFPPFLGWLLFAGMSVGVVVSMNQYVRRMARLGNMRVEGDGEGDVEMGVLDIEEQAGDEERGWGRKKGREDVCAVKERE